MKSYKILQLYLFLTVFPFSVWSQGTIQDQFFEVWLDSTETTQNKLDAIYEVVYINIDVKPDVRKLETWYNEMNK